MRVLVLGAGAIGASVAYHLAARGADVVVVERAGVACAASGKSGGFLALDWCDGTPLMALARRSFTLHAELADQLPAQWGYRRMTTYAATAPRASLNAALAARRAPRGASVAWTSEAVSIGGRLGTTETTAQVHPAGFTAAMMQAATQNGARLRRGVAGGLLRRGDRVVGAEVDGERLDADAVVLALGPWSLLATEWLPLPPVFGLKGHSLVFETGSALPAEALFVEYREADGTILSPEIFPRADGTTYVCAISSEAPVPLDPVQVAPDDGATRRLQALCAAISPVLAASPVLASQACFRPVTRDCLPLIGAVAGAPGAFVATGHSVWGILNAPATGEAVAQLVLDGVADLDLSSFDPGRLSPLAGSPRVAAARQTPAVRAP